MNKVNHRPGPSYRNGGDTVIRGQGRQGGRAVARAVPQDIARRPFKPQPGATVAGGGCADRQAQAPVARAPPARIAATVGGGCDATTHATTAVAVKKWAPVHRAWQRLPASITRPSTVDPHTSKPTVSPPVPFVSLPFALDFDVHFARLVFTKSAVRNLLAGVAEQGAFGAVIPGMTAGGYPVAVKFFIDDKASPDSAVAQEINLLAEIRSKAELINAKVILGTTATTAESGAKHVVLMLGSGTVEDMSTALGEETEIRGPVKFILFKRLNQTLLNAIENAEGCMPIRTVCHIMRDVSKAINFLHDVIGLVVRRKARVGGPCGGRRSASPLLRPRAALRRQA